VQLRTEVEIAAPPSVVWAILLDNSRYHEWNPFITTLEGVIEQDAVINIVVSPPDSSDFRFRPRVLAVSPEQELRWRGNVWADFLFAGEHYFQLEQLANGNTRFTQGEDFEGYLLRFLGRQMTATAQGFVYMNQALKRRAEAQIATGKTG
jgi:hypothetical protein